MKLFKHLTIIGATLTLGASAFVFAAQNNNAAQKVKADDTRYLDEMFYIATTDSSSGRYWRDAQIGSYVINFDIKDSGGTAKQIFTTTGYYINDHLDDAKDGNGDTINLGDGIIINGKTLRYWTTFNDGELTYPRPDGVLRFPLSAGGLQSPVNVYLGTNRIQFMFNTAYFPMDSTRITFKAGVFAGYCNTHNYVLQNDVTFYATLNTTPHVANSLAVDFVRERNEITENYKILATNDLGEKTATGGAKFHTYQIFTNIPRDGTFSKSFPVENYRYMYDNILMNGKSLTYYASWGRGNSKDFTDLSDTTTQVTAYEMQHPTGNVDTKYDTVVQMSQAKDTANFVLAINVPDQLKTDFNIEGDPTFAIRDGSAWHALKDDTPVIARANKGGPDYENVEAFVNENMHMDDYDQGGSIGSTGGDGSCVTYFATAKTAYEGLSQREQLVFATNSNFADAKTRFSEWARINHYSFDSSTGALSQGYLFNNTLNKNGSTIVIAIVVTSVLAALASGYFVSRRKRR